MGRLLSPAEAQTAPFILMGGMEAAPSILPARGSRRQSDYSVTDLIVAPSGP